MSNKNVSAESGQRSFNQTKPTHATTLAGAMTREEKERRSRIVMRSRVDLLEAGLFAGPFGQNIDRQWINGEITLAERRAALHSQYFSDVTGDAA